ncbi:MAG TPA: crosslink repair DNA glycosylase YcaQ family protein [Acidimicrobiales bacterium]|nr:crosslink repair DNA glycosylase YcaQ family protein [Acidimicrobiales bacterium]
MAPGEVSIRHARRAQLAAQGLLGRRLSGGAGSVLSATRGVQLDTISVLARSHELIAFARLGALPRRRLEKAYWGGPPFPAFEFWYHAACIVPIEEWPNLAFKRAAIRARGFRWHRLDQIDKVAAIVLEQVRERGPLTANELGGAKRGGPWWDWSETKITAEWLLDVGELVCTTRRGFQRVYDLPERAIPSHLLGTEVPREEAVRLLAERAGRALGVATAADLASYVGVKQAEMAAVLRSSSLEPVRVEGWRQAAYAAPEALEHPAVNGSTRGRPVLLSPFDSVVCDRARLERLFGFRHRLEAYVPRHKRVHGYYTMPVLAGDRFVARVDPGREGSTLVARSVFFEPAGTAALGRAARATAAALLEAASWVGCDSVAVERVEPEQARDALLTGLKG